MNWYTTLDDLKTHLGVSGSARDGVLRLLLEAVCRWIDSAEGANRHFYVVSESRYFDTGRRCDEVLIDDALSLSALAMDSELDGTFDGEAWAADTDYILSPWNGFPKRSFVVPATGNYGLPLMARRYVKATGLWGYGDGRRADPVDVLPVTVTVADESATAATASATGIIREGMTLRLESEQVFVSGVSGTALTVERAVNGTTGAAHDAVAAAVYRYPGVVVQAARAMVAQAFRDLGKEGMAQERIGNYSYQRDTAAATQARHRRMLAAVTRKRVA